MYLYYVANMQPRRQRGEFKRDSSYNASRP